MKTSSRTKNSLFPNERIASFINLKGKIFAEYNIIYRINDKFSVSNLSQFKNKYQLLFQRFESKVQQLNLVMIDSLFPSILSDIALEVFLNNISSFNQYIDLKKTIKVIDADSKVEKEYFKYKFLTFIHQLLYSEIATDNVFNGKILTDRIYCLKNNNGEIEFYSFFEQNKLQQLLFEKMRIEINLDTSSISRKEVKLCLKIFA